MNRDTKAWPEDVVNRLEALHKGGLSFREIAAALGRSRSAVAGKLDRMKAERDPAIDVRNMARARSDGGKATGALRREAAAARVRAPAVKIRPENPEITRVRGPKPGRLVAMMGWCHRAWGG